MHLSRSEINIQLFKRNVNKLYIFVEQPNKITGIVLRNPERRREKKKRHIFHLYYTQYKFSSTKQCTDIYTDCYILFGYSI